MAECHRGEAGDEEGTGKIRCPRGAIVPGTEKAGPCGPAFLVCVLTKLACVRSDFVGGMRTGAVGCASSEPAAVDRAGPELFLDAEELVVFRDAVGAAGGARLDLAGVGGDGDVGDRHVLGLARAV